MLFSAAVTEYMADKDKRLRATTLEGYRSAIRCHLMPQWGDREIETITFEQVQDWVDGFDLPGTAEKAYKTFRQIYRWVLRRHQLRIWDVTQGVELPQKPTVRRPTLTAEQERVTLKAIVGQPFEAAVLLGAALGLRRLRRLLAHLVEQRRHVGRLAGVVGGERRGVGELSRLPLSVLVIVDNARGVRRVGVADLRQQIAQGVDLGHGAILKLVGARRVFLSVHADSSLVGECAAIVLAP